MMSGLYRMSKATETQKERSLTYHGSARHHAAPHIKFVTISQTPRHDIVPEMLAWVGNPVEPVEFGALDGMSPDQIQTLAPVGNERRFVSRLADGNEVALSASRMHERVAALLEKTDQRGLAGIVLLCTGRFPEIRLRTPFVSAQAAVDHGALALAETVSRIGILVPHEEQARDAEMRGSFAENAEHVGIALNVGARVKASHATPYRNGRFEEAARDLADTDLIVMHCMGYDEAMLARVRVASGRPTLLARRLVASALRQLL